MTTSRDQIRAEGKTNCLTQELEFTTTGRLIRRARLKNEWYDEVKDPEAAIARLRASPRQSDIFTFIQRPPGAEVTWPYQVEADHVAGIPLSTFDHWWQNQVSKKIRKNVRRSEKRGVTVRTIPFDDTLIHGILEIYRETPLRSGRPFRHYRDDFETCRRKHETFLDRSTFIGAFLEDRLIGFIKMVDAGSTSRTMQFIVMDKYRDLSAASAMLAHAVRDCIARGQVLLAYGKLEYGKRGNAGLEDFKKANGFVKVEFPRYFVPLNARGTLILRLGLQRDLGDLLPKPAITAARELRTRWYQWRFRKELPASAPAPADESD